MRKSIRFRRKHFSRWHESQIFVSGVYNASLTSSADVAFFFFFFFHDLREQLRRSLHCCAAWDIQSFSR